MYFYERFRVGLTSAREVGPRGASIVKFTEALPKGAVDYPSTQKPLFHIQLLLSVSIAFVFQEELVHPVGANYVDRAGQLYTLSIRSVVATSSHCLLHCGGTGRASSKGIGPVALSARRLAGKERQLVVFQRISCCSAAG